MVEKKQEQLTKQANIIGDLRGKIHQLELNIDIMNTKKDNNDEMFNMKQALEAARRNIFALEKEALHLSEENKQIKVRANKEMDDLEEFIKEHEKGVSRTKKNLQITIQEKDDYIRHLTQKLKNKEDPSSVTPESEIEEQEEGRDVGETEAETIEANPWQVKQGTTFICPICNFTRRTESQIRKHMKVHDENGEDGQHLCSLCPFQTNNRDQLKYHVETKHRGVQAYDCQNCEKTLNTKDELDTHIINTHNSNKTTESDELIEKLERTHITPTCNKCNLSCNSKDELNNHIFSNHRSYKPCINYASNSCEYEKCRFRHIKLKQNEHICYNCGVKNPSIKSLMAHIKEIHGAQECTKFLARNCDRGSRCWYNHGRLQASRPTNSTPPKTSSEQDFPQLPTLGQARTWQQNKTEKILILLQQQQLKQNQQIEKMMSQLTQLIK